MSTFVITAKSNIPIYGQPPIQQFQQCTVNINAYGVTATTLFTNIKGKEILAQQMNLYFGTGNFFTRDNVTNYAGYFKVTAV